jgi:hypothetical protein
MARVSTTSADCTQICSIVCCFYILLGTSVECILVNIGNDTHAQCLPVIFLSYVSSVGQ